MRPGEIDGDAYHFVSLETFEKMVAEDAFLEHARVFDNRYGTARASVEALLASGKHVILEIDWQGARQVKAKMPDTVCIFILPPSREVLEQRLRARGTDDEAVITRRMRDADREMSHYGDAEYLVRSRRDHSLPGPDARAPAPQTPGADRLHSTGNGLVYSRPCESRDLSRVAR